MNRKYMIVYLTVCFVAVFAGIIIAVEKFNIEHPIKSPSKFTDHERCDNCGMNRNEWARTRHEFENAKGKFHTCSIHCIAVMGMKLKERPDHVRVAEYLRPENMLDADKAFYVIGSNAPGTMTAKSKVAFPSKEEAENFAAKYGGTLGSFDEALAETEKDVHGHGMHKH